MKRSPVFQRGILRRGVLVWLVGVSVLLIGVSLAQAAPAPQSAAEGQALFQEKCVACHTIGAGKLVGPDLQDVTNRRDVEWLQRWIAAPDQVLAAGDPIATQLLQDFNNVPMPNQGLNDAQVASLIAFLQAPGGAAGAAPAAALPAGDADMGRELFTGEVRLENNGAPCMGCHSVAGIGALGGGALGPDLTPAFNNYSGAAGLEAFLAGMPTATMNAVWQNNPLTPVERAHLIAFLETAAVSQRAPETVIQLTVLAVIGAFILLVLPHYLWRHRLTGVRRPMLNKAQST